MSGVQLSGFHQSICRSISRDEAFAIRMAGMTAKQASITMHAASSQFEEGLLLFFTKVLGRPNRGALQSQAATGHGNHRPPQD